MKKNSNLSDAFTKPIYSGKPAFAVVILLVQLVLVSVLRPV